MTVPADRRVRLRPLSLLEEDGEVLVGEPESGTFVTVPAVGGVVLRALQRGATVSEAAQAAAAYAGEPVDVAAFVATLEELGFLADSADHADPSPVPEGTATAAPAVPRRTAPLQTRRWLHGLRPELVRPLFGRFAWTCYGVIALGNVALLGVAADQLWPRPSQDAFVFHDIGLSALLLVPLVLLVAAAHEAWHWLAARAAGVPARFGVDRRMVFLVFETDLSRLWTLPRRQRYSPLLAGMALDSVVLALVLLGRLAISGGLWSAPELLAALLAAWQLALLATLTLQCMIFLRTDLYAVLVTATGCRNLWRVKSLLLRRACGRLTDTQAAELASADEVDLRVGRWFRWLWLAGLAAVTGWFVTFVVPVLVTIVAWAGEGLAAGPGSGQFWYRGLCALLLLAPLAAVVGLALRHLAGWWSARRSAAGSVGPPEAAAAD